MGRSRYGSYRGKSRFQVFMKVVIVLLAIVLVLAVAAFFLLEKYMVYSADGARLQLPWWGGAQTTPAPVETVPPTPTLVVDTPEPTPTPPAERPLQAVLLPRTALYDGTAGDQLLAAGANAALFDMKADDGSLGYVSAVQQAISAKTSAADPALNAAIRGLNGGELYTVARVSCFRDNTVPRYSNALAMRTSGGNWRDAAGIRWLDPANVAARKYVVELCVELADLGFDEILLDNSGYPTTGRLETMLNTKIAAENPKALEHVVTSFYQDVRQALADYPEVRVSVVGTTAVIADGYDVNSAQNLATLAEEADRIWIPAPADGTTAQYTRALEEAGVEAPASKLVLFAAEPGPAEDSWAIFGAQ